MRASGPRISWASSADEPCAGGVKSRPPPKVNGTTALITIFPRQASLTSGSVVRSPLAGTASTTTSAALTASALDMPITRATRARAASSAALARARSGSRDPIRISGPAAAHRAPSPEPSLPVPPTIPMRMQSFPARLSEQIAGRIAEQLPAAPVPRVPVEPANDGHRDATQLAHHRLGGARHLVGQRQDGGLQHVAGRIPLAEIALERQKAGEPDRDVGETLAPRPAEGVGDDDGQLMTR